ncbi:hypothetical protein [Elizabethkingia anophelis]|uniref:hypothetical protein n=1 Tax=Elizabethkingia anophelis TaxID=1117645 RepID=UPI000B048B53|nr:hypothetical protein [Elizabethkingia anophelis]CAH1146867.1 hypothetical protein EAVVTKC53_02208 [Elizabethkingia anophelis]CAI9687754.1 hypothetical protein EAVVTKC53_03817 [Elizabethkingia anophelis]
MKKHLFYPALWGILTLSTLSSCRTEDNLNQQKQEKDMRFAVFVPQSGKTVNYADGFAHLMKRYDSIHKTNLSGMNNTPVIIHLNASTDKNSLSSQSGETFVAFNIRSQTVTEENGNKWVVFPEVTNGKIANLVVGFLSEKETKVHYYLASKESELYKNNISLFQSSLERYMKRINKLNLNASINPVSYVKETQIEEVIITVPKPYLDPRESFGGINPAYNTGGGSCSDYGGCINDYYATGGGGGSGTSAGKDPCNNLKAQANDAKFKEKVSALDNDKTLGYDHEMGYAAGYPPKGTGITDTQYPPMDNKPGTTSVKLPDGDNYFGFMHTHNNYDSNGDAPIKIFSPGDIATFLTSCVRNADENGNMGNAFAMVITSQGNYILKYSGDGNYGIGPNQIQNWETKYRNIMQEVANNESFTQEDIEKAFAQFLKDVVKVDGLEVYQSDKKTGATSKINADGTKNPC